MKSYLGHGDDFDLDVIRVCLSFLISSVLFYDLKASLSNYATARTIVLSTTTLNNRKRGAYPFRAGRLNIHPNSWKRYSLNVLESSLLAHI